MTKPHPSTHVRCPECRELVRKDATTCPHCQTGLRAVPVTESDLLAATGVKAPDPALRGLKIAFVVVLVSMLAWCSVKTSMQPKGERQTTAVPDAIRASKEALATMINLNGKLCANVINVAQLGGSRYRVSCILRRDGSGNDVYEVDLNTGLVR